MTDTEIADRNPVATLPPAPPAGRAGIPGVSRRVWVAGVAALLLVSSLVGAALLPVPYVSIRPGAVRPVTEQVLVEGAASYPPEQSIGYTTVNVGQTSLLEALAGWLDDEVDVLPEERVRGDRTPEESRRYNAQLMDTSKLIAITVALRHLGMEVPIRTTGTVVRDILDGTPAAEVLQVDDVVVAVDGQPVDEPGELTELLQAGGPGAAHTLTVERPAGATTTIDVAITTIPSPQDAGRAVVGISAPEDRIVDFDFPIDVTIDSGNVGGPSAGLAFTLAVLDVLTEGELTGGSRVATTGTIALDGTVGEVGGAAQKAIAVRDAGYDVFLVPSAEEEEVRAAVGRGLRVIPVDTLVEALEALDSIGGNAGSLNGAGRPADP